MKVLRLILFAFVFGQWGSLLAFAEETTSVRMDYRRGAAGSINLGAGWAPAGEAIGIWTSGPRAEIIMPVKAGTRSAELLIDVTAYVVKQRSWQEVAVFVGQRKAGFYRFDTKAFERVISVSVKADEIINNRFRVVLELSDPKSPAELNVDLRDDRQIAIALREMTLRERR